MNILSIKNLSKQFGENIVFKNINIDIKKGDIIAVIGHPGAGKSAFLRAINFLDPPTKGDIFYMDNPITSNNIDQIRLKIGMVHNGSGLFSHLTILENMIIAPIQHFNISKVLIKDNAMMLLKSVGLVDKAFLYPHQLSEEQKIRVAIVRCLGLNPEIILLDEITKGLEQFMVNEIMSVIKEIAQKEYTILMATDEISFIRDIANRIIFMDEMGIYEEGAKNKVFTNPQKPKTIDFINHICSFRYEVNSKNFDFIEMFCSLEKYFSRNNIEKKSATKLRLLLDELVVKIVISMYKSCSLIINYSDKSEKYLLSVSYKGDDCNALEKADDPISVKFIKQCATKLWHTYKTGENTIYLEI